MKFSVYSASQSALFAHMDQRLVLLIWRTFDDRALSGLQDFVRHQTTWKSTRVAMIGLVEEQAKLPEANFRSQSAELMADADARIIATANVICKKGLMGTALRSVATGISLVSRTTHPLKVFSEVAEGSQWIAQFAAQTGVQVNPKELETEIQELRLKVA
jgi:hypothetical protein